MRKEDEFLKTNDIKSKRMLETKKRLLKIAEKKTRMVEESKVIDYEKLSMEQIKSIIHDLRVHQIELEMQNIELNDLYIELEVVKNRYFNIYDMAPEGYLILSRTGVIIESNLTASKMLKVTKAEMLNKKLEKFIFYDDQDIYYHQCNLHHGADNPQACDIRMVQKDGSLIWVRLKVTAEENVSDALCRIIMSDITLRKNAELAVIKSGEKYKSLFSHMSLGLLLCQTMADKNGKFVDGLCIEANKSFMKLFNLSKESITGKNVSEIIVDNQQYWLDVFEKVVETGELNYTEYYFDNLKKYYGISTYRPEYNHFAIIVKDLAENIEQEADFIHSSYHDYLTGIYNRRFYMEELIRLDTSRNYPLTMAIGDINGLKLVNDSFGHLAGDELIKTAVKILKEGCRLDDIIARIGGDEFVILLPKTDEKEAEDVIARIQKLAHNTTSSSIALSISFGFATKYNEKIAIEDVFNEAEDEMYRNKLIESNSVKNKMMNTIMQTLYEKNSRESAHSKRVGEICEKIAIAMDFKKKTVQKIKTAGIVHDIGDIAIEESTLNCSTVLTESQWKKIKSHPEIGYRILGSLIEMSDIANDILEHHERWDGTGYPKGLKGVEISMTARIITLAAAYDAMTTISPYRSALSKEKAIEEIIRCSGSQFDPDLVTLFIEKVVTDL